jgi:hypothetical protein
MARTNSADLIEAPDLVTTNARSGRAASDDRGNNIWEWQTQPGVYSRDISSQQLQQFEAPHLQLVETKAPDRMPPNVARRFRSV